ncbi:NAD-dependent epimerase/dehydratase family protein [bacterium]|nr:NAD-dependent epimerase/dehydratase family protein [bacterium]
MGQRVLVTGGAGFIGHHLVQALLRDAWQVTVLDNLSLGKRENVSQKAEFILGDVRDSGIVSSLLSRVDAVCHLAAKVSIRASLDNFYDDADTNLMGTLNLLKHIAGSPVRRFCFASSMAVYADSITAIPIPETHVTSPQSPYGQAKLTAEYYVRTIARANGIDWFNLRLFNTYGPNQTFTPYVGVITIFCHQIRAGQNCVIYDDGEQRRDFIHVSDVVQGWLKALSAPSSASGTYNIGTGTGTSVNEIAGLVCSVLHSDGQPVYQPNNALELRNSIADISAAQKELGYQPQIKLEQGLPSTIRHIIGEQV